MRLLLIITIVAMFPSLSSCGMIGGTIQGLGDDLLEVVNIGTKML
jgi:hypothetical protein